MEIDKTGLTYTCTANDMGEMNGVRIQFLGSRPFTLSGLGSEGAFVPGEALAGQAVNQLDTAELTCGEYVCQATLAGGSTVVSAPVTLHSFASEWSHNRAYHWHECTGEECGAITGSAAHKWDRTGNACTTCGMAKLTGAAVTVAAPEKGESLSSAVACGSEAYSAAVAWYEGTAAGGDPVTGPAKADQVYTAQITLTAGEDDLFAGSVSVSVNGEEAEAVSASETVTVTMTFPKTASGNALSGSVTVTGTPVFEGTLEAVTDGLDYNDEEPGALSYQWYRGSEAIEGARGSTYTLAAGDVGKTIKVEVSALNNSGSVFSAPTAAVSKKACTEAAVAAVLGKTADTVTVTNVTAGQEYAVTTGQAEPETGWNTTGRFTGLAPDTNYTVYTRVKETATTLAGASTATAVTTDPFIISAAAPVFADGSSSVTLTPSAVSYMENVTTVLAAGYDGCQMTTVASGALSGVTLTVAGQDLTRGTWKLFFLNDRRAPLCPAVTIIEGRPGTP